MLCLIMLYHVCIKLSVITLDRCAVKTLSNQLHWSVCHLITSVNAIQTDTCNEPTVKSFCIPFNWTSISIEHIVNSHNIVYTKQVIFLDVPTKFNTKRGVSNHVISHGQNKRNFTVMINELAQITS